MWNGAVFSSDAIFHLQIDNRDPHHRLVSSHHLKHVPVSQVFVIRLGMTEKHLISISGREREREKAT